MIVTCLLAVALLLSAVTGVYRLFSYLAALLIVAVLGVSSLERNDRELDLAPYTGLLVGLLAIFATGLTVIWLRWRPGVTEYEYVLGLPVPTLAYVVFIWLLPILGAVYYSLAFPAIGDEEVVDDIVSEVRRVQRVEGGSGSTGEAETDREESPRPLEMRRTNEPGESIDGEGR